MFEHVVGSLTEILWRGDIQELSEGFKFDDRICLRLLTLDDWNNFDISPNKPRSGLFGIEVKVAEDESGFEILYDVLLSLQLLHNALIFYDSIHYIGPDGSRSIKPTLDALSYTFMHAIGMDDLILAKEFFTSIRKIDPRTHASLKIACDRYGRIKTSKFIGDQLIDACIAYEALFFEGEQTGGNRGLAVAVACSMLIGESIEERNKIKEVIKTGFTLRNKIMHGSDYSADSAIRTSYPFIDYLRQSIVKLLKQIN